MKKLFDKVVDLLKSNGIEHEVTGNVIHTNLCTIEVWGKEITVNENPVELENFVDEVLRNN